MNRAKRIRLSLFSLAFAGLFFAALPVSGDDTTPAAAASEAAASPQPADAATAEPADVTPGAVEFTRPVPKVRQGTPIIGNKVGLIILAAGFFLVSAFMAALVFRSPKSSGQKSH